MSGTKAQAGLGRTAVQDRESQDPAPILSEVGGGVPDHTRVFPSLSFIFKGTSRNSATGD